jgi:hypothetical protein
VERILTRQHGKLDLGQIRDELPPLLKLEGEPEALPRLEQKIATTSAGAVSRQLGRGALDNTRFTTHAAGPRPIIGILREDLNDLQSSHGAVRAIV